MPVLEDGLITKYLSLPSAVPVMTVGTIAFVSVSFFFLSYLQFWLCWL